MVGEEPTQDTARNAYWKDLAEVSEKFGAQVRHFDDSYWHLWLLGRSVYYALATHSPKIDLVVDGKGWHMQIIMVIKEKVSLQLPIPLTELE